MLPTLAIVKSGKTTDYVVGFDDLGGTDDFSTSALEQRSAGCRVGGPLQALPRCGRRAPPF